MARVEAMIKGVFLQNSIGYDVSTPKIKYPTIKNIIKSPRFKFAMSNV